MEENRTAGVDDLDNTDGTNTMAENSGSAVKTIYIIIICSALDLAFLEGWRLLHYIAHSVGHFVSAAALSPALALSTVSGTTYLERYHGVQTFLIQLLTLMFFVARILGVAECSTKSCSSHERLFERRLAIRARAEIGRCVDKIGPTIGPVDWWHADAATECGLTCLLFPLRINLRPLLVLRTSRLNSFLQISF